MKSSTRAAIVSSISGFVLTTSLILLGVGPLVAVAVSVLIGMFVIFVWAIFSYSNYKKGMKVIIKEQNESTARARRRLRELTSGNLSEYLVSKHLGKKSPYTKKQNHQEWEVSTEIEVEYDNGKLKTKPRAQRRKDAEIDPKIVQHGQVESSDFLNKLQCDRKTMGRPWET